MSLEGSSRWAEAAILLGASVVAGCGSRSELKDGEPNSCEDTASAEVLCCEEDVTPDWQGIADVTTKEQTPEQLCQAFANGTEAVICFLDKPWNEFLADWAETEVDEYGDTIYSSHSYTTPELPGEIECYHSSYVDDNGVTRENAGCNYWEYDTEFEADIWRWEPREYPGYTEVGIDFRAPGQPFKGYIIGALYIDKEQPTPESGEKADTPYVWLDGVEEPDNLQYGECGEDYKDPIKKYSAKISEIAKRVVFQQ